VGAVVEWRNAGVIPHNVVFDGGPRSDLQNGGQTYQARFGAPGIYHYECSLHLPGMVGTITVTG
jgi:plastocyanin